MEQQFDKLEEFRVALNCEAKLLCNAEEVFDREKAADFLKQLSKSWRMSEDGVIAITIKRVCDTIDGQLRKCILQFADAMGIQYDKSEIRQRWDSLSAEEKNKIADGVINYLAEHSNRN